MKKTSRRGFTLIELMVVMAIIAILAVLGLSGLTSISTNNILDRTTEEVVNAIRESQNLAISVASDPYPPALPATRTAPMAWGVKVDSSTNTFQPFYLDSTKHIQNYGSAVNASLLKPVEVTGDTNYFFTTPFGKYYSSTGNGIADPTTWQDNAVQRPYDIVPIGGTSRQTVIKLTFRNATKSIFIEPNGDVYAK